MSKDTIRLIDLYSSKEKNNKRLFSKEIARFAEYKKNSKKTEFIK
jgi:hypothetical protein